MASSGTWVCIAPGTTHQAAETEASLEIRWYRREQETGMDQKYILNISYWTEDREYIDSVPNDRIE